MASLRKAFEYNGHVFAEHRDYTVYVEDGEDVRDTGDDAQVVYGYWVTFTQGAMPPHSRRFFDTLEEVEDYERQGNMFGPKVSLDWQPVTSDDDDEQE